MDQKTTLIDIIKLIYKRRKQILIATSVVTFLTIVIMLMMPDYFKSTTVFYAASPDLSKPDLLGTNDVQKRYYGDKKDIDRILTIANSNNIKDYLIDKYDLYEHYDIDSTKKYAKFKLRKKFSSLYKVMKNERDAIELSVEDKDKVIAAKIANEAREKVKSEVHRLIKSIQKSEIEKYRLKIKDKNIELKRLNDSIQNIKNKYSIFDPDIQGESLTQQLTDTKSKLSFLKSKLKVWRKDRYVKRDSISLLTANIAGNEAKLMELDSLIKLFDRGSLLLTPIVNQKNQLIKQLSLDNEKENQLSAIYNSDFKVVHLVEKAEVPLRKYRPKRSLYVIAAFLLSLFFSILVVLIMEESKAIKFD
ncbi:MAG TPA: hypothetical protein ENK91_16535 [Bacteroidetes bacterium]|nr:hypothetical protein [Bacteroidota bacterium]